jgi:hypothetical protein
MRRPNAGEASGLGFDHGVEIVVAQGALLLEVGADGGEVVVGQGFMHEAVVSLGAIPRTGSGSLIQCVEVNLTPFCTYPNALFG